MTTNGGTVCRAGTRCKYLCFLSGRTSKGLIGGAESLAKASI